MPEYSEINYSPPEYYGDSVFDQWIEYWIEYWENLARYYPSDYSFRKFWHDRWLMDEFISNGLQNKDETCKKLRDNYHYPSFAPEEEIMRENISCSRPYTLAKCPKCSELIRRPV